MGPRCHDDELHILQQNNHKFRPLCGSDRIIVLIYKKANLYRNILFTSIAMDLRFDLMNALSNINNDVWIDVSRSSYVWSHGNSCYVWRSTFADKSVFFYILNHIEYIELWIALKIKSIDVLCIAI